jgi:hypothetical protein
MDIDVYRNFIELVDLNKDFEIYETYNVKQLAILVKVFHNLTQQFKSHLCGVRPKAYFISVAQKKQEKKFIDYLDENYPIVDVSDKKETENRIIRNREIKKFNATCHANNKIMTDVDVLKKITEIIKGKSTFGKKEKKEYDNEQIACQCGCISYRKNLSTHKKSKLHEKRLAEVNKLMEEMA